MNSSSQPEKGYRVGNLEELELRFKCAYCHLLLREPMQGDCGHRYCRNCVQLMHSEAHERTQQSLCLECDPSDTERAEISPDRTYPDLAMKREINKSLQVSCPNSPCDSSMLVSQLDEHLKVCDFRPEPCSQCGDEVALSSMEEHKLKKCRRRLEKCSVCGDEVPFELLDEHKNSTCIGSTVHCEYCQSRIRDTEEAKQTHWLKECPVGWHTGKCPYGCQDVGKDFEEHRKQHLATHLDRLLAMSKQPSSSQQQPQPAEPRPAESSRGAAAALMPVSELTGADFDELSKLKEKAATLESRIKSLALPGDLHQVLRDLQGSIAQGDKVGELLQVIKEQFEKCYEKIRQYELKMQKDLEKKLDIERKHQELVKLLAYKEMKILDLERRVEVLEHAGYDGVLVWKITDVRRRKEEAREGKVCSIYSPPFYTGKTGYKMCGRLYLNGDGAGKNSHISLFFVIMRGAFDALLPWPFAKKVSMMLLDQNFEEHVIDAFKPDTSSSSFKRPTTDMNIASGCPLFMPLLDFESGSRGYVKDDTMFIKFIVDKSDLPT